MTLADRRASIEDEIQFDGKYTHNIITLELQLINKEFGREEANRAIRDLGLDKLGWSENEY